jgi:hypothetical protein
MMRKLQGKEKFWAGQTLDMLKEYGVSSIQIGSKVLTKKGKDVLENVIPKKKKLNVKK